MTRKNNAKSTAAVSEAQFWLASALQNPNSDAPKQGLSLLPNRRNTPTRSPKAGAQSFRFYHQLLGFHLATTGKKSDFPKSVAVRPKPQTVTAPLGQYGYNPLFADWLVAECQNLHGYGDFDDDGAYFIRIDDVMDAYRKHPEIVKNGWDCREIPAILERWAANRMAWDIVFLRYSDDSPR